jgi:hypothetical protein
VDGGDLLERARTLGRAVEEVAEVVEKYRLLEALRLGEPGRTIERRDAMRAIAARFPAALREWDEAPAEEITRRRREAEATLALLVDGAVEGLRRVEASDWLRWSIRVHARLRRALRIKRWLAGRALDPALAQAAAAEHDASPEELRTIAGARRVSEAIYRQVAAEEGVPVEAIKAALFPKAAPGATGAETEARCAHPERTPGNSAEDG